MLSVLASLALAASSWSPQCTSKTDPSVWFVFMAAADAKPVPEFECKGLFIEQMSCTQTLGFGKIKEAAPTPGGLPTYELRYLPSGDLMTIMTFLNGVGGGVAYKPPAQPAASPAATLPPPKPEDLMRGYLNQRNKASAATKGVTLHVWYCPESPFFVPEDAVTPVGMLLQEHIVPVQ